MTTQEPIDLLAEAVEQVLCEWERANLDPEGAGVRRGMALEIRLAMRRAMSA